MPYPNEHSARFYEPSKFSKYMRRNDFMGSGIDAVMGLTDDGPMLQALRFKADKWSTQEAKKWLIDHDLWQDVIKFEEATGASKHNPLQNDYKRDYYKYWVNTSPHEREEILYSISKSRSKSYSFAEITLDLRKKFDLDLDFARWIIKYYRHIVGGK